MGWGVEARRGSSHTSCCSYVSEERIALDVLIALDILIALDVLIAYHVRPFTERTCTLLTHVLYLL